MTFDLVPRERRELAPGAVHVPDWLDVPTQRSLVGQMQTGAILEGAEDFQRIAQTRGLPRDNH